MVYLTDQIEANKKSALLESTYNLSTDREFSAENISVNFNSYHKTEKTKHF